MEKISITMGSGKRKSVTVKIKLKICLLLHYFSYWTQTKFSIWKDFDVFIQHKLLLLDGKEVVELLVQTIQPLFFIFTWMQEHECFLLTHQNLAT